MTREEQKIYDAAKRYIQFCNDVNFGLLVTAVMDLPMSQWPKRTCAHKAEHVLKSESLQTGNTTSSNVRKALDAYAAKPEPGDAAHPDKIVELETGKEPEKR